MYNSKLYYKQDEDLKKMNKVFGVPTMQPSMIMGGKMQPSNSTGMVLEYKPVLPNLNFEPTSLYVGSANNLDRRELSNKYMGRNRPRDNVRGQPLEGGNMRYSKPLQRKLKEYKYI